MTGIIDYGMGNLFSVAKAVEQLGHKAEIVDSPDKVLKADRLILPGVGAFGDAMGELEKRALVEPICEAVRREIPLLGVCLGLQLLFEWSEEGGRYKGLGLLKGHVARFGSDPDGTAKSSLKIPHMGWNQVVLHRADSTLFAGVPDQSYFYFVHSYYAVPGEQSVIAGTTDYGMSFASVVSKGTIHACQFHPEKSHRIGRVVLKNFLEAA